jgi:hypothetical protein
MADSKTLQDLKMLNEWSEMVERIENLEKKFKIMSVNNRGLRKQLDLLYSLDVIQNYTKYRKIREDYERNRIIRR